MPPDSQSAIVNPRPVAAPTAEETKNMFGSNSGERPHSTATEHTDAELQVDKPAPEPVGEPFISDGGPEHVNDPDYRVDPATGQSPHAKRQADALQKGNEAVNARKGEALSAIQAAPDARAFLRAVELYAETFNGEERDIAGFDVTGASPVLRSFAATLAPALEAIEVAPPSLVLLCRAVNERQIHLPARPTVGLSESLARNLRAALDFTLDTMALPPKPAPREGLEAHPLLGETVIALGDLMNRLAARATTFAPGSAEAAQLQAARKALKTTVQDLASLLT